MSEDLYELPKGWVWSQFDELIPLLTDYQSNGSFSTLRENVKYYEQENYAILVRLKDLLTVRSFVRELEKMGSRNPLLEADSFSLRKTICLR